MSYGQSKLADLMFTQQLAAVAAEYHWDLLSVAPHPGSTRTNLQTAGASLGKDKTSRPWFARFDIVPTQEVEQGAEPRLYAATSPEVTAGDYFGPTGRMGLVGPAGKTRLTRRALDDAANARLWTESERLTGVTLAECAS
ncbi:SDR family NAD(P)-dependent oxidoreductase [Streptomyces odonnellii]|uniref:hypothetical protein n=1 Tax=Streptomyces odonnellii TaxID=1417980 RepID=UPI0012FF020A|nr:hypothetical protein [Streptomyces odonnellii]